MSQITPFEVPSSMTPEQRRELAVRRIKAKVDFRVHVVVYLAVNAMLIAIWWLTGNDGTIMAQLPTTFFWPIFPLLGWGVGLVVHGYTVYFADSYTEEQIQREMKRLP
jgi:hypothetical protein